MKSAPKSVARVGRGASSIADNIKAFNKSLGAQAAIAVLKIIKPRLCKVQEVRAQGRSW